MLKDSVLECQGDDSLTPVVASELTDDPGDIDLSDKGCISKGYYVEHCKAYFVNHMSEFTCTLCKSILLQVRNCKSRVLLLLTSVKRTARQANVQPVKRTKTRWRYSLKE